MLGSSHILPPLAEVSFDSGFVVLLCGGTCDIHWHSHFKRKHSMFERVCHVLHIYIFRANGHTFNFPSTSIRYSQICSCKKYQWLIFHIDQSTMVRNHRWDTRISCDVCVSFPGDLGSWGFSKSPCPQWGLIESIASLACWIPDIPRDFHGWKGWVIFLDDSIGDGKKIRRSWLIHVGGLDLASQRWSTEYPAYIYLNVRLWNSSHHSRIDSKSSYSSWTII